MSSRWPRRRQRGLAGLVGVEVALFSTVLFVSINDRLYGGLTPYAVLPEGESPTGAHGLAAHLERWPRLLWLWVGRPEGLLLWAPVCALAFVALGLLARSRRERLARVLGEQADVEVTTGFLLMICASTVLVAAFLAPTIAGPCFAGHTLVAALPAFAPLVAWGWRRFPRTGSVLAAITLATTVWVLVAGGSTSDGGVQPRAGRCRWTAR